MTKVLAQRPTMSVGETEIGAVNYTDHMDSDELLTGTPTVVEDTTTDLTLANKVVNSETYEESDTGDTVAVSKAVTFTVSGGNVANSPYTIVVTVDTDKGRVLINELVLSFE